MTGKTVKMTATRHRLPMLLLHVFETLNKINKKLLQKEELAAACRRCGRGVWLVSSLHGLLVVLLINRLCF